MFMQARQTLPSATPAAAAAPPGWTRSMMGSFCACEPRGNAFPLRPVLMRENLSGRTGKEADRRTDRQMGIATKCNLELGLAIRPSSAGKAEEGRQEALRSSSGGAPLS
jgi:hypothetical protein